MWAIVVIFMQPVGKPASEFIVVNRGLIQSEEKLFFIGPEGSFDQGVLVGSTLVDHVVLKAHISDKFLESTLKFQSVIGLNKHRLKG